MKQNNINKQILYFGSMLLIPFLIFFIWDLTQENSRSLEILGPAIETSSGTEYHKIGNFRLIDQREDTVTLDRAKGKIIVANFFFTTCPSICPQMTMQLKRVQQNVINKDVVIFSFSVNPETDSTRVLATYAENYEIDPEKWHLLTGDKKEIYKLARNSFLLPVLEGDGGSSDFIHSELLVLIDHEKRIRGYYDGTDEEEVNRLINDIEILRRSKPV